MHRKIVYALFDNFNIRSKVFYHRAITGKYILGYDTIHIVAKDELKNVRLEQIRTTV